MKTVPANTFLRNLPKYFGTSIVLDECPFYTKGDIVAKYHIKVGKRGGLNVVLSTGKIINLRKYALEYKKERGIVISEGRWSSVVNIFPTEKRLSMTIPTRLKYLNTDVKRITKQLAAKEKNLKHLTDVTKEFPEWLL
jgi:hypothetical protein